MIRCVSLIALGVLSLTIAACGGGDDTEPDAAPAIAPASSAPAAAPPAGGSEITVKMEGKAGQYKYNPTEFNFKAGQSVTFTLVGDSDTHTFTADDLKIDEFLEQNETRSFTFTFDKAGTYKVVCIPHPEMTGTIRVQ